MATGPKIATSPLEILTNDGTREPPIVNKYWGPVVGGGAALVVTLLTNWATKKPFMSGKLDNITSKQSPWSLHNQEQYRF
jgi:hypothetical protein